MTAATPNINPWLANYDPGVPHVLDYTPESVCSLLDKAAEEHPDTLACIFRTFRLTYAQLREQAEIMAANLREHGLEAGDRIALMLPNLPQTVVAFWAVLKAGGVVVMTNPLYMEKELLHHIEDAGIRHIITVDLCWPKLEKLRSRLGIEKYFITSIADVLRFPYNWLYRFKAKRGGTAKEVPYDGRSILPYSALVKGTMRLSTTVHDPKGQTALIQYTGGTTGVPKGVMLSHANLTANIKQTLAVLHTLQGEKHVIASMLPLFHVYGLCTGLLVPTALYSTALLIPRYEPGELLRLLHQHGVTIFPGAPSVYLSLMQHKDLRKYSFPSLQCCISGSAPIPGSALEEFQNITGSKVIEGYGLTESSPITHLTPLRGMHKFGSIGMPLPGTEARIVDMDLGSVQLPPGKLGELIIRGPQVMQGYYKRPDETAGTIRNGWLYTGDIAYMDEDGYFFIVDRKKDMVIVGGYNVYPREIDEVLLEHPNISEAVAVAVLHPTRGETLKAYVVPKEGTTLTQQDVIGFCRKHLANYKVPRQVEFRGELPRAITGKVLRRVLRNEELERYRCAPENRQEPVSGNETCCPSGKATKVEEKKLGADAPGRKF